MNFAEFLVAKQNKSKHLQVHLTANIFAISLVIPTEKKKANSIYVSVDGCDKNIHKNLKTGREYYISGKTHYEPCYVFYLIGVAGQQMSLIVTMGTQHLFALSQSGGRSATLLGSN